MARRGELLNEYTIIVMVNNVTYIGHRKFEKIAKRIVQEDIESQTGDQFFIDKEVYRRHMSELTDTIDDSSLSNFLIKYDLQIHLDELMQYFNPNFSRKRHFVSLKYMSSKYGYHLCYMALREAARENDDNEDQDNIQVVQALESTGDLDVSMHLILTFNQLPHIINTLYIFAIHLIGYTIDSTVVASTLLSMHTQIQLHYY